MSVLCLDNVQTFFGEVHAVKGISFTVEPDEIVALIGSNGAGKSTTLNTISGITPANSGHIHFYGQEITHLTAHKIVESGILQVPEGRRIFAALTVEENLDMGAYSRQDRNHINEDKDKIYSRFPILAERRGQLGGTFSGGEQQMLAIARALMARPKLLMLDEPSLGLAPMMVSKIFELIREINSQDHVAMLLVEQNARMALKLAKRAVVLDRGEIVKVGTSNELIKDPAIERTFLGSLARRADVPS
jgi:branched-chain amino acid transport system ATP-binding protein